MIKPQKLNKMKIAVLLTCFNRKQQTISCLEHILKARCAYNNKHKNKIYLSFYITDDNCSDGTPDAIKQILSLEQLLIIPADGNAYWAGGMRLAWKKALDERIYDFYLLLNDDTIVSEDCFSVLMFTNQYCLSHFNPPLFSRISRMT